jgi:predicted lipid-binding transport protein (Tim44 family)
MNKLYLIVITLFLVTSMHASTYKTLLEEQPEADSPANVFMVFQKAAAKADIDTMRNLSTGQVHEFLKTENHQTRYIERAKDIDWTKEVKWKQAVEGDSAIVQFRYYLISKERRSGHKVNFTKVDGKWKYGD